MLGKHLTINDALRELYKEDLTRLIDLTGFNIKKNLKKDAIIDSLSQLLLQEPKIWLKRLPHYELTFLKKACEISSEQIVIFDSTVDIMCCQEFCLVEYNVDKETEKDSMWLLDDMKAAIAPHIGEVIDENIKDGTELLDNFLWGMLALYGFFSPNEMKDILIRELGKEAGNEMFLKALDRYPCGDKFFRESGYIVYPSMGFPDIVEDMMAERGFDRKPLKKYEFIDIVKVGATAPYFSYHLDEELYGKTLGALARCGQKKSESIARLSRLWWSVQEAFGPVRPTDEIKMVIGTPRLNSIGELNDIIEVVNDYTNSLPRWFLKGNAPSDIRETPAESQQFAAIKAAMERAGAMGSIAKVGRNDPCPCGSGLKYKNCHGKTVS